METIVDTLCTNMLSDKEQLRDISSIGLKTVIGELPPASSGKAFCTKEFMWLYHLLFKKKKKAGGFREEVSALEIVTVRVKTWHKYPFSFSFSDYIAKFY